MAAVMSPAAERLAEVIRTVDPEHRLGAGALGEAIAEHLGVSLAADPIAQWIRTIDGDHSMSPDDLAVALCARLY